MKGNDVLERTLLDTIGRRVFKEKVQANKEKFKRNLKLAEKNSKWLKRKKHIFKMPLPASHPLEPWQKESPCMD